MKTLFLYSWFPEVKDYQSTIVGSRLTSSLSSSSSASSASSSSALQNTIGECPSKPQLSALMALNTPSLVIPEITELELSGFTILKIVTRTSLMYHDVQNWYPDRVRIFEHRMYLESSPCFWSFPSGAHNLAKAHRVGSPEQCRKPLRPWKISKISWKKSFWNTSLGRSGMHSILIWEMCPTAFENCRQLAQLGPLLKSQFYDRSILAFDAGPLFIGKRDNWDWNVSFLSREWFLFWGPIWPGLPWNLCDVTWAALTHFIGAKTQNATSFDERIINYV